MKRIRVALAAVIAVGALAGGTAAAQAAEPSTMHYTNIGDYHTYRFAGGSIDSFKAFVDVTGPSNCLVYMWPVTLLLSQKHRTWQVWIDPCGGTWHGHPPHDLLLSNDTPLSWENTTRIGMISGRGYGNYRARYKLVATSGGRTLLRGSLTVFGAWADGYRIYEGTDGFVNTCIDKNYRLYSSHLRLYCAVKGTGYDQVTIRRGTR